MPQEYLKESASQTAGPFLHIGMYPSAAGLPIRTQEKPNVIASPSIEGERIRIEGVIYDGGGNLVIDAQIELWQANSHGKYNHPADDQDKPLNPDFNGWGRAVTDFETGLYWFETIKPGPVPGPRGQLMAPHVSLWICARGINIGLHTRMYFSDEEQANDSDAVMNAVENGPRRNALVGQRSSGDGLPTYRFDIYLQGENETPFFDI
ncbi:MAG: protocatechuate 3,4-dioxygenase subunit alpha [Methyloligellaceae bacterium]